MLGHSYALKLAALLLFLALGVCLIPPDYLRRATAQDTERGLDRLKYPGEPVSVVDLGVAGRSLGGAEHVKRAAQGMELREIRFGAPNGWLKDFKVTLKNVSGRVITRIEPELVIGHTNLPRRYSVIMTAEGTFPLQPDAEVTFYVDSRACASATEYLGRHGADAALTASFDYGTVAFDGDLTWRKGVLLRRNATDPQKWDAIKS
jgi:hypothetical protein